MIILKVLKSAAKIFISRAEKSCETDIKNHLKNLKCHILVFGTVIHLQHSCNSSGSHEKSAAEAKDITIPTETFTLMAGQPMLSNSW
jgi:hypothetical protein